VRFGKNGLTHPPWAQNPAGTEPLRPSNVQTPTRDRGRFRPLPRVAFIMAVNRLPFSFSGRR
jgi:hypothetical protein